MSNRYDFDVDRRRSREEFDMYDDRHFNREEYDDYEDEHVPIPFESNAFPSDDRKEIWFDIYKRLKRNNDLGKMFNRLQSNAIKRKDSELLKDVMLLIEIETGKKIQLSPKRR